LSPGSGYYAIEDVCLARRVRELRRGFGHRPTIGEGAGAAFSWAYAQYKSHPNLAKEEQQADLSQKKKTAG